MSPTFIENDHEVLIGGTPGGSRIITSMLLLIIGFVDQQNNQTSTLIKNPRYHHQYFPDEVSVERDGFNDKWVNALKEKEHKITTINRKWGNMQLIIHNNKKNEFYTGSDPRGEEYISY